MRCRDLSGLLFVVGGFLLQILCLAAQQNPEVSAKFLGGNRIAAGEQGVLMVQVSGAENVSPPEIRAEGLSITYKDSEFAFANRSVFVFYYQVMGETPGTFTIPAIRVQADGQEFSTLPLEVTIFALTPGDAAADARLPRFLKLGLSQQELYAGQIIPLTLTVYSRGRQSIIDAAAPTLKHDAFVINRFTTINYDGLELDGITFSTATLPGSLFALTAGEHVIGPAETVARLVDSSSTFGALTGYYQNTRTHKLVSNTLRVTVLPLPETGKPVTFRGAVGSFRLSASASPLDLKIGDPISIEFTVTGPGNFDSLSAPVFQPPRPTEWRVYEARKIVDPAETSNGITPGRASFSQIVMPQGEVTEIPPFELAFFDPSTGAYSVERTQPIPIRVVSDPVRPGAAQASQLDSGTPVETGFAAAAVPAPQFNDILFIRTAPPRWRTVPATITGRPVFWIAQSLALAVFSSMIALIVRRRRRAAALASEGLNPHPSFKQCLKQLRAAETRGAFFRIVEAALAAWERERVPRPGPLPPAVTSGLLSLRSRCKRVLHGGPLAEETLPLDQREAEEIRGLLNRLRKAIG